MRVVGDLSSDGHYPIDGLFGVYGSSAISLFATDDINVAPNLVINHIAPITLQSGGYLPLLWRRRLMVISGRFFD